jgi:outer membrane lipoprotein-sorting protein
VAFADVAEALNNVHSATWKTTTVVKGPKDQTTTWSGRGMFLAPSHERTETTTEGEKGIQSIQIVDGQKDKTIVLSPATKTAMVINLKNVPQESPFGKTFQGLRALVAGAQNGTFGKAQRLDVEKIDGRRAEGFRIQLGAVEVKIWADPKTSLPIRVEETTSTGPDATGPEVHIVMTDFQVGMDFDASLFSLDVPAGYTVQRTTQLDLSKEPIAYLAEALKWAAEHNDGVFPATLRGDHGIEGVMRRAATTLANSVKDSSDVLKLSTDVAMKLGGALGVVLSLSPGENDWHYAGKDVKLNTPNRPIFWFKPHRKSTTYQVLYADLSVKKVPAEEAPKVPQSEDGPRPEERN